MVERHNVVVELRRRGRKACAQPTKKAAEPTSHFFGASNHPRTHQTNVGPESLPKRCFFPTHKETKTNGLKTYEPKGGVREKGE